MHTGVRNLFLGILVVVIAIVLGAVAVLLFQPHSLLAPTTGSSATYTDPTYGYSFTYPASYSVQQYSSDYTAVGTPTANNGFNAFANVDVIYPDVSGGYASYQDLVYGTAINDCAADGPESSIACTDVATSSPFTALNGVVGIDFYLTQVTRTLATGATATTTRGPFYAFDISAALPAKQYVALLVHVPIAGTDVASAPVVAAIANSLQFPPVAPSATSIPPMGTGNLQTITNADMGKTITLTKGEQFAINLDSGLKWMLVFDPGIISQVSDATSTSASQGIYEAEETGTTTLHATGAPICNPGEACPDFLVEVVVNFLIH